MASAALFKRCEACPNKIPFADGHSLCLYCLGETHQPATCPQCRKLTKPALKHRLKSLRAYLWEKSLKPMEAQAQSEASVPSPSSRSKSSSKPMEKKKKKKLDSVKAPAERHQSRDPGSTTTFAPHPVTSPLTAAAPQQS
ncbi:hypothetical protein JRQ81_012290 [Phrynocephalus forsythii]|uniref:Uncharacterized protein n=1 Tax=Phrynocephalus forsythii TaxID=171643 RepID=A0A9Q0X5K6_9SAUR|nr:hypothetical protein JRQ81_012290 [Phrynocephalus forsythii]